MSDLLKFSSIELDRELKRREKLDKELKVWKETILKNYKKKHSPSEKEINHVLDYFTKCKDGISLQRLSYPDALTKANEWQKSIDLKLKNTINHGIFSTIIEFDDGMKVVKLLDKQALKYESKNLQHCVSEYSLDECDIFSLRDKNEKPLCTIELDIKKKYCLQVSGKKNIVPSISLDKYIFEFFNKYKVTKIESDLSFEFVEVKKIEDKKTLSGLFHNLEIHQLGAKWMLRWNQKGLKLKTKISPANLKAIDALFAYNLVLPFFDDLLNDGFVDFKKNTKYLKHAAAYENEQLYDKLEKNGAKDTPVPKEIPIAEAIASVNALTLTDLLTVKNDFTCCHLMIDFLRAYRKWVKHGKLTKTRKNNYCEDFIFERVCWDGVGRGVVSSDPRAVIWAFNFHLKERKKEWIEQLINRADHKKRFGH